jgi:hypothetical protein
VRAATPENIIVHKFRSINENLFKSIQSSSVYFPRPAQLNDPHDCQIDLIAAFRLARNADQGEIARWEPHARRIIEIAATCGVFSVCVGDVAGANERLMWSHYADDHAGVCLTYQIPSVFAQRLIGMSPVHYGQDVLFEALRALDLERLDDIEVLKPVITAFLTTKAPEWQYESEGRLIAFDPGLVRFNQSWLKQLCFGLRTPAVSRRRLIELVQANKYRECHFAELARSESGLFDVELREFSIQGGCN